MAYLSSPSQRLLRGVFALLAAAALAIGALSDCSPETGSSTEQPATESAARD